MALLYKICFVIINLLAFFLLGMLYAGWIEAGKHQGLAGGAIVLSYGVIGIVLSIILSVILIKTIDLQWIKRITILMLLITIVSGTVIYKKAQKRNAEKTTSTKTAKPRPVVPN